MSIREPSRSVEIFRLIPGKALSMVWPHSSTIKGPFFMVLEFPLGGSDCCAGLLTVYGLHKSAQ